MKRILVVLFLCGCSTPPEPEPRQEPAIAPSAPPIEARQARPLTLKEALELADRHHPDIREAQARVDAAQGRLRQAGAWPDPELVGRVEGAGASRDPEYLAGVSQPLPIGGRVDAARRAEERDRERLDLELEVRRRTVRARVHAAFAAALHAAQARDLQASAAEDADRAHAVARALVASGEGLPVDITRARVESIKARLERDRSASLAREALARLGAAIGSPVDSVTGSLEMAFEVPAMEAIRERLQDHPALKAARAGVLVHEARLDLAEAQRVPDVNLELLYRRLGETDEDSFDAGVSVRLPVFDGSRGRVREALGDRRAAQARADQSALELGRDLQVAHARFSRALDASRAMKESLLEAHDEIARVYEARYAAGDASLTELLPVRRERHGARLAYLEALREVMEAWTELSFYIGG
jgi:outer membrane protein TolC